MQQALNRALPIALVLTHFYQFTRKRHGRLAVARGLAQRRANRDLLHVNVAAAIFKAGNLGMEQLVVVASGFKVDTFFNQTVLHASAALQLVNTLLRAALLLHQQIFHAADF